MCMKINSITTSPSFGKVLKANAAFSDTQMEIAKDIKNKMNTVYDGHFKGQTPNDWLENRNCDTLVQLGNSDKSVKFSVTSRKIDDPAKRSTVKQYYVVGEYSQEKPFYVSDIKESYKKSWGKIGIMTLATALYFLAAFFAIKIDNANPTKQTIKKEKTTIVDSLKKVVKNDTIVPLKIK